MKETPFKVRGHEQACKPSYTYRRVVELFDVIAHMSYHIGFPKI